jgi:hypothetical protein
MIMVVGVGPRWGELFRLVDLVDVADLEPEALRGEL